MSKIIIILITLLAVCAAVVILYFIFRPSTAEKKCEEDLFPEPPCCGHAINLRSQIKGGIEVREKELPFMVNLDNCGGSLINAYWVLSAAHCFLRREPHSVSLGSLQCARLKGCDNKAAVIEVDKIITHENYDAFKNHYNDIALLQLKTPVSYSDSIYPICLPFEISIGDNVVNEKARVAGWGETKDGGKNSQALLATFIAIWDREKCKMDAVQEKERQICAGGTSKANPCKGDAGGPMFMQLPPVRNIVEDPIYQIGIVSFRGTMCGRKGHTGTYTNVSTFIPWIQETITSFT